MPGLRGFFVFPGKGLVPNNFLIWVGPPSGHHVLMVDERRPTKNRAGGPALAALPWPRCVMQARLVDKKLPPRPGRQSAARHRRHEFHLENKIGGHARTFNPAMADGRIEGG